MKWADEAISNKESRHALYPRRFIVLINDVFIFKGP